MKKPSLAVRIFAAFLTGAMLLGTVAAVVIYLI